MKLRGQAGTGAEAERGYAMAALLVAMSVAAVLMTMAMPVWKQMSQREKEEELVFRGLQYTHALRLFQTKYANASPPNFDVLVEQRFLRKKYKDPITNDDFQPILAGQALPGTSGQQGASGAQSASGPGATTTLTTNPSPLAQGAGRGATTPGAQTPGPAGGIIGVTSKSKDKSIRIYNGRSHYNEWAFINVQQVQTPGAGAPGTAAPGQRGQQPGQPGQNPFGGQGPLGGQRGRGANPNGPGNPPPGRGFGPPFQPGTNPFQPGQPLQPIQPGTGRGRGN